MVENQSPKSPTKVKVLKGQDLEKISEDESQFNSDDSDQYPECSGQKDVKRTKSVKNVESRAGFKSEPDKGAMSRNKSSLKYARASPVNRQLSLLSVRSNARSDW